MSCAGCAAILGVTDQPLLFGFKYVGAHPQIGVATGSHADVEVLVTLLDQTRATTMWTREGRRLTSVSYQVRNNRRQFLKLALPEGAELWSASVGGRGVQPAKAGDGRVMVPLLRSQDQGGELSAFAVQVVYCRDRLGLDPEKLNVNGGSIAIGHPFGMTGSRMVGTLANEMRRRKSRYGVVTMCVGGGQGAAGLFECVR